MFSLFRLVLFSVSHGFVSLSLSVCFSFMFFHVLVSYGPSCLIQINE